jgi:AcrR family transcriptional regulator
LKLPEHLASKPVGRKRLRKDVLDQHQRERVLAAATEVFAKRGYVATTVDDIVAAAKIGVGSFYALFGGKQDCFLELYDRIVAEAQAQIEEAVADGAPWPDRVCTGIRMILELAAAQPSGARIVVVESHTAGRLAEDRYAALVAQMAAILREGRSQGSTNEGMRATFEAATVAGVAWLLYQQLAAGRPIDVAELFPEMVRIVLALYIGSHDAERLIEEQNRVRL